MPGLAGAASSSSPAAFVADALTRASILDADTAAEYGRLYSRFLSQTASEGGAAGAHAAPALDWAAMRPPSASLLVDSAALPAVPASAALQQQLLNRVAIVKLNGGVGATMGCVGPKSAIPVRGGLTFLDLTVRQVEYLNQRHSVDVPLVLMNSYRTHADTVKILRRYAAHHVSITCFTQSCFPRLDADNLTPLPLGPFGSSGTGGGGGGGGGSRPAEAAASADEAWTTGGHGEVFRALERSGVLSSLLAQGRDYIFISNVDNLGATVDLTILNHVVSAGLDFAIEVTAKTRSDVQGGMLVELAGRARLVELSQVPAAHKPAFAALRPFASFSTNSLWVALRPCAALVAAHAIAPPVLVSERVLRSGVRALELETAAGAAIEAFERAVGIVVPRARFLPVKSTADLLAIQCPILYSVAHGSLVANPARDLPAPPVIKLGPEFSAVDDYARRIPSPPDLLGCEHLTVSGDVVFGEGVKIIGTVIILAAEGAHIDVPRGAILEDTIVTGALRLLAH